MATTRLKRIKPQPNKTKMVLSDKTALAPFGLDKRTKAAIKANLKFSSRHL